MAGGVQRREQTTPNPENKIRALALPAETMKAQVPVSWKQDQNHCLGKGRSRRGSRSPLLSFTGSEPFRSDWAQQPTGTQKTYTVSGGGSCWSHSSSYHLLMVRVPGRTEHCRAGTANHILQMKNKSEARSVQCFAPGHTASKRQSQVSIPSLLASKAHGP